jgi:aminoglycoside phosphotransferase family enzyme
VPIPLAERDRLDRRIAAGRLRARHARALGRALAAWHAGAVRLELAEGNAAPAELARRTQAAALAIARDPRIPQQTGAGHTARLPHA